MLINTGRPACAKHTTHKHTAFWLFRRALSETAGLYSAAWNTPAGEHYGQPENYCRNIYATTHTAYADNCLSAKSLALFSISISSFQTTSCCSRTLLLCHIFL
jgi:hypothetical protein